MNHHLTTTVSSFFPREVLLVKRGFRTLKQTWLKSLDSVQGKVNFLCYVFIYYSYSTLGFFEDFKVLKNKFRIVLLLILHWNIFGYLGSHLEFSLECFFLWMYWIFIELKFIDEWLAFFWTRYYIKNVMSSDQLIPEDSISELSKESQVHLLQLHAMETATQLMVEDFTIFRQIGIVSFRFFSINKKCFIGSETSITIFFQNYLHTSLKNT